MAEASDVPEVGTVIIIRRYEVTCPRCGLKKTGEVGRIQGYEEVFYYLEKDGWKLLKARNIWICPECRKRKVKEIQGNKKVALKKKKFVRRRK